MATHLSLRHPDDIPAAEPPRVGCSLYVQFMCRIFRVCLCGIDTNKYGELR